MSTLRSVLALACVAVSLGVQTAGADPIEPYQIYPCEDPYPSAITVPTSTPVAVRVAVVLAGIDVDEGRAVLAKAEQAYAPLNIELKPTFLRANLRETDANEIFNHTATLFGGKKPPWAQLVLVLTDRQISSSVYGEALAGASDCIGGIAHDDKGFSVAETGVSIEKSAEVVAHELGHQLGADHHHANCAQGVKPGQCTIMFPDAEFTSLAFGSVEGTLVRMYAEAFAKPLTTTPPPDGTALNTLPAPTDPCAPQLYSDPADGGGAAAIPGLNAGEGDIVDGHFVRHDGKMWFRTVVKEIDGNLGNATKVTWRLYFGDGDHDSYLETVWRGTGAPQTVLVDGSTTLLTDSTTRTPVPGTVIVPGTPGMVDVPWPLAADASLRLGAVEGSVGPLFNDAMLGYNIDDASPVVGRVTLTNCAS